MGKSACRDGVSLQHVGYVVLIPVGMLSVHIKGPSVSSGFKASRVCKHPRIWYRDTSLHPGNYFFVQKTMSQ